MAVTTKPYTSSESREDLFLEHKYRSLENRMHDCLSVKVCNHYPSRNNIEYPKFISMRELSKCIPSILRKNQSLHNILLKPRTLKIVIELLYKPLKVSSSQCSSSYHEPEQQRLSTISTAPYAA